MPALNLRVYVSPRAAILAGKTKIGDISFDVAEHQLQPLDETIRLELALAYESGDPIGKDPSEPLVAEATLEGILPVLKARAVRRADLNAERVKEEARAKEAAAVAARAITAKDNARSRALRKWIEEHGDDEQRGRMSEGFLPEDEILEEVSEELLGITGFRPYDPLHRGHACECACAHQVTFQECAPPQLDSHQFLRLQEAREAAPEGAKVEPILHKASCPTCKCVPLARVEARVTLEWHGWLLVRSYAIP
jgi:hypothetical protein